MVTRECSPWIYADLLSSWQRRLGKLLMTYLITAKVLQKFLGNIDFAHSLLITLWRNSLY